MTEEVRWLDRRSSYEHLLPALSASALRVLMVLETFANHQSAAWPARKTIAQRAACTEKTVTRSLAKLVKVGILVVAKEATTSRPTTYFVGPNAVPQSLREKARNVPREGTELCPPGGDTALSPNQIRDQIKEQITPPPPAKESTPMPTKAPPARVVSEKIQEAIPKIGTVHNPFALATAAKAFAANGGTMDDFDLLVDASRGPMLSKERRSSTERVAILIHWLANEDKWRVQIAESKSRFNMIEGRKKPVVAVPKSMDGLVVELMRGMR